MEGPSAVALRARVDVLSREEFERAWHGPDAGDGKATAKINNAQLSISRHGDNDFRDRQIYLFVDEEPWGKVRYGQVVSREITPGRHRVRAFNTLFSHTIEVNALPGEHVRVHCTNGMPTIGFLMMIFLHVTALRPRLEIL
jgi:hypothetical protein